MLRRFAMDTSEGHMNVVPNLTLLDRTASGRVATRGCVADTVDREPGVRVTCG
jgi:hypothetical protein